MSCTHPPHHGSLSPSGYGFDDRLPPELRNNPLFHVPSEDQDWGTIAKLFYELDKATVGPQPPGTPLEIASKWLRQANRQYEELVPAGMAVLIPEIPGIPVRAAAAAFPVPQLPLGDPPPDPNPPISPRLTTRPLSKQSHADKVHPGCVYFHEFFIKTGPLQVVRQLMGTVVWVEFEGRTSIGVVADVTVLGRYGIYEADRYVLKRWQWQEIWHTWRRLCAEPGPPGDAFGRTRLHQSGWVPLPDKDERGEPRLIHAVWSALGPGTATGWADNYAAGDDAADDTTKRDSSSDVLQ